MDFNAVLSKLLKGDELSDKEKSFVEGYDVNKVINDAVAAQKRKVDSKVEEVSKEVENWKTKAIEFETALKEKANAEKSDVEKLQHTVSDLSKQLKAEKEARENEVKERSKLQRVNKLKSVLAEKGISFVKEVDHELMTEAFVKQFDGIEELEPDVIDPIVEQFATKNKAALVDKTGHGSGGSPHDGSGGGGGSVKFTKEQIAKMSPDEFEKNRDVIFKEMAEGNIK